MNGSTVRVGLLGCGTVGSALIQLVQEQAEGIESRTGLRLEITRVAVRNASKDRGVDLPMDRFTNDAASVVNDPDVDVVIEVIGGIEPARQFILDALKAGKPVVTANKELLANHGGEVFATAEASGVDVLFEAAVGGGIPLVRPLRESLLGEPIDQVMGIVNGTTNYILTRMTEGHVSYAEALAEAQELGYAEADPTADVEGYDAGAKIAILASIAFGARVVAGDVYHEGISGITAADIAFAGQNGFVVKLVAIAEQLTTDGRRELAVRVHPVMLPTTHPLASVRGSFNAVFVQGAAVGELMFYGRGAGGNPTASAVLGDLIDASLNLRKGSSASVGALGEVPVRPIDELESAYYLHLHVVDRPGVLAAVAGVFGAHDVSISSMSQGLPYLVDHDGSEADLVFITHDAFERDVQATLRDLRELDVVRHVGSVIRVLTDQPAPRVKYVSTRGAAPVLEFGDVLLAGLARDGGLYVPESWPSLPDGLLARAADAPYDEVAVEVMWPFVEGSIDRDDFAAEVVDAYRTFDHPDVVPLRDLGAGLWLAELFHGPTLAFKDVALQLVGRLFDHELARRGERVTIVGATSGDTGSAAIEACRDRPAIDIVILHPAGRVSDVQRRQMTTVSSSNVHNLAVEGTFDDCQDLVKALFADEPFRERLHLSAVNSINWARVMAQVVYYVTSAARLTGGREPVSFAVPTGNFGNVFAGYCAQRMGLPVAQFAVASNANDILTRFLQSSVMEMAGVRPTLSPSMDIQVSSNFERLLFELWGRDGAAVAETMLQFRSEGRFEVDRDRMGLLHEQWSAASVDDDATIEIIREVHERLGVLVDPHTAVGLGAAAIYHDDPSVPMVAMATAHPAKFPDAVESATGIRPPLPDRLAGLFERPERYDTVSGDYLTVRDAVAAAVA